ARAAVASRRGAIRDGAAGPLWLHPRGSGRHARYRRRHLQGAGAPRAALVARALGITGGRDMNSHRPDALDEALSKLPKSVPTERGLVPRIQAEVEAERPGHAAARCSR